MNVIINVMYKILIFTKEIKSKLLHCNEPYEMEEVIMDEVTKSQTSLEDSVARGVKEGRLNPKVKDVEPKTLLYKVPGGMLSNLLSQLTEQGLQDKY